MSSSTGVPPTGEKPFFEQQRELLLQEIGIVSATSELTKPRADATKEFRACVGKYQQVKSIAGRRYRRKLWCRILAAAEALILLNAGRQ